MAVGTIDHEGKTVTASYGNPGPDSLPIDADSVFEIGSITKVFTAIVLADMADRGEVALDDPVAKYLPGNARMPERNGRQITLLDLSTQNLGAATAARQPQAGRYQRIRTPTTASRRCTTSWRATS